MARVRYLGWVDREPPRQSHGITTSGGTQLQKSLYVNEQRYIFRGRTGKQSQVRIVEDPEAVDYFQKHEDFEVDQS